MAAINPTYSLLAQSSSTTPSITVPGGGTDRLLITIALPGSAPTLYPALLLGSTTGIYTWSQTLASGGGGIAAVVIGQIRNPPSGTQTLSIYKGDLGTLGWATSAGNYTTVFYSSASAAKFMAASGRQSSSTPGALGISWTHEATAISPGDTDVTGASIVLCNTTGTATPGSWTYYDGSPEVYYIDSLASNTATSFTSAALFTGAVVGLDIHPSPWISETSSQYQYPLTAIAAGDYLTSINENYIPQLGDITEVELVNITEELTMFTATVSDDISAAADKIRITEDIHLGRDPESIDTVADAALVTDGYFEIYLDPLPYGSTRSPKSAVAISDTVRIDVYPTLWSDRTPDTTDWVDREL